MSKQRRDDRDRYNRQLLIYRALWGTYAELSCLPEEWRELVDLLAENKFIDFDRLAVITANERKLPRDD